MATGNFYEGGNHGLHIIDGDDEFDDTLDCIRYDLEARGWTMTRADDLTDTPRSFDTGRGWLVYNKNDKAVAFLELCMGYYDGANINIYTGDNLIDLGWGYDEDGEVTHNKRDIATVVKIVERYTTNIRRVATFSNGETIYERINK